ncbi:RNase J family beta-CASP ribonuclease [Candidatus Woesearchaeota archaeon]|nr:RNase J family beta-CASP ribonuclease [Candidatus Woesearchaeota archaeon]
MSLEIIPLGGYSEVGRNSTMVLVDDEAVILDMGLHMDNYINYTNDDERDDLGEHIDATANALIAARAVPNIYRAKKLLNKVKAICIGHGHLDHVGAVPFLAGKFPNAEIHGTRYTMEILKEILASEGIKLKNKIKGHAPNAKVQVGKKIMVEFVHMTHSIPQAATMVVHTPYGKVVYAVDFKLDNAPVLGEKPNYKRLEKIGKEGVKALIMDSLYSHMQMKTPSESIAKEMLKDVLLGVHSKGNAIIVTTFASHMARLKTIVEIGKMMKRKIIFMGRSFDKYVSAAKRAGVIDFTGQVEMVKYGGQVKKYLRRVKHPEKCMFVVTGHQAEPGSILPRMVFDKLFPFREQDNVVFSCSVIPVPENIHNREKLDKELKRRKIRIFTDVHVSGHAYREDHREMIRMIHPKILIPTHAERPKLELVQELAEEMGYSRKQVKILRNGERIRV